VTLVGDACPWWRLSAVILSWMGVKRCSGSGEQRSLSGKLVSWTVRVSWMAKLVSWTVTLVSWTVKLVGTGAAC